MSWSFSSIGKVADVRAEVAASPAIPFNVQNVILETLDTINPNPHHLDSVRVEGYGHINTGPHSSPSSIGKLEVVPFRAAPAAPKPQPREVFIDNDPNGTDALYYIKDAQTKVTVSIAGFICPDDALETVNRIHGWKLVDKP